MLVALDARLGRKPSGIGRYVYQLAEAAGAADPDLLRPLCHPRQLRRFRRSGLAPSSVVGELTSERLAFADVVHGPNFHAPVVDRAVSIATVHDLGFIRLPECHPPGMPERLDQKIRAALPRTARFICVSEDTRQAFAAHYRIPLERCDHVPHGVDTKVFHHEVDRRFDRWVRIRYRLPRPFLLFVGAMVPRKDVVTLLNAFALIARQFSDLDVVVAGHKTRRWASDWSLVQEWIREHHELRTRLRVLNYVTARDLPHLYRASEVVTLPSITEGFGLTVLEGFASGKPVVTTRAGAIPEVGGDAAYYAPPKDPEAFAAALTAALRGDDRERRAAEARAIVTAHTWARTWRLTRASYELAAG